MIQRSSSKLYYGGSITTGMRSWSPITAPKSEPLPLNDTSLYISSISSYRTATVSNWLFHLGVRDTPRRRSSTRDMRLEAHPSTEPNTLDISSRKERTLTRYFEYFELYSILNVKTNTVYRRDSDDATTTLLRRPLTTLTRRPHTRFLGGEITTCIRLIRSLPCDIE